MKRHFRYGIAICMALACILNSFVLKADAAPKILETEEGTEASEETGEAEGTGGTGETGGAAAQAESENTGSGGPEISAPSAVLMEVSTGTIVYNKNGDEQLRPASVTKVMTLLLIFEALERGDITLEQEVTTSEYASSMGGSQVFLEPGEVQTVQTLIKCIAVASANDACVVMAELLAGSETEFVNRMNARAGELGMNNTHFVNCCGLDVDGHVTTAHDIALMSRELIANHPEIYDYCQIWMDTIVHKTKRGEEEFGLTNTNKLIRQYEYATGLKTGRTSLAKYCVSATARKDGIDLIAVIMAAPDHKVRFQDAITLFGYGFGLCRLYQDEKQEPLAPVKVKGAIEKEVEVAYEGTFSYLDTQGMDLSKIEKKLVLPEEVSAPIKEKDEAGALVYSYEGREIGRVPVQYQKSVEKASFSGYFYQVLKRLCVFRQAGA